MLRKDLNDVLLSWLGILNWQYKILRIVPERTFYINITNFLVLNWVQLGLGTLLTNLQYTQGCINIYIVYTNCSGNPP